MEIRSLSVVRILVHLRQFGDLIASTDPLQQKSIKVLAVKDPGVSAFILRYGLTSVLGKI